MRVEITKDRLFTPTIRKNQTVSDFIHPNPPSGVSHQQVPTAPRATVKKNTIVVSISGVCSNNGRFGSKASYGVYFGLNSPYNASGVVAKTERQRSQNAVLFAAQRAIEIVEDAVQAKVDVKELIIKTHSSYLAKCMSEFVWIWEENGYRNAAGKPVVNRSLVEKVQDMVVQGREEGRLRVRFWCVGKADNLEGVSLAKDAFAAAELEEERKPTPVGQREAWEDPIEYWTQIAPMTSAAQVLCRRLGILLKKQRQGYFAGITAPIRRLIVTGEDRPQNFERLFGPDWEAAVLGEWRNLRFEVLSKPPMGTHLYDMAAMLDTGAPWIRPRPATLEENERLEKMMNVQLKMSVEGMMELLSVG